MKKSLLLGCIAVSLAFASCDKDGSSETRTIPFYSPAISILTYEPDGQVVVSDGLYYYDITMSSNDGMTGKISSPDLIINNTNLSFTTNPSTYVSSGFDAVFENVTGKINSNSTLQLNNAIFEAIDVYDPENNKYNGYYINTENIGNDYTFRLNPNLQKITIAKYNIGEDYRVNTFQKNTFFQGTTKTTYFNPAGFETNEITYRFIINKDEESGQFSADMILYNARFASEMPKPLVAILVKGLTVDFTADGVSITGQKIIPEWYSEATGFTELPSYIFQSIDFHTTGDYYIDGELDYVVGEDSQYVGHFEGSYIKNYYLK